MYPFQIDAACACLAGRENNNEDNFFFDGRCLPAENSGLKHSVRMTDSLQRELCFAVFDGISTMDFGEAAAFAAARSMQTVIRRLDSYCIPEKAFLREACQALHESVLQEKAAKNTEHMGAYMAALFFSQGLVYLCCVGSVKTFRLRGGEFLQLSKIQTPADTSDRSESSIQFLGMDTAGEPLKPFIAKGELHAGDKYLICTESVTSVMTNLEIDDILIRVPDPASCAQALVEKALRNGSRKNITAIVIDVLGNSNAADSRRRKTNESYSS